MPRGVNNDGSAATYCAGIKAAHHRPVSHRPGLGLVAGKHPRQAPSSAPTARSAETIGFARRSVELLFHTLGNFDPKRILYDPRHIVFQPFPQQGTQ